MSQKEVQNEPCGVLVIDKPNGMTSHDIVNKVRRLYGTRRVGHTGTLDPMATGILTVLIGRAAKAAEYLACDRKTYRAILRLGLTTDTEDTTGKVLTQSDSIPNEEAVMAILPRFCGEIMQVPPMYSALKVGGQKLYDMARRGEVIERQARPITIHRLEAERLSDTDYALTVTCSAGTYIRTLCADIGRDLGCGGAMAALRRTRAGRFDIADCHTLEALEALTAEERMASLKRTMTVKVPEGTFSEIVIPSTSPAIGETVVTLNVRAKTGSSIVTVIRKGVFNRNIGPEWEFAPGDTIIALGNHSQIAALKDLLGVTS